MTNVLPGRLANFGLDAESLGDLDEAPVAVVAEQAVRGTERRDVQIGISVLIKISSTDGKPGSMPFFNVRDLLFYKLLPIQVL